MKYSRSSLLLTAFIAEGLLLISAIVAAEFTDIRLLPLTDDLFRDIMIGTIGASLSLFCFFIMLSGVADKVSLIGSLKKTVIYELKPLFSDLKFFDMVIISFLAGFSEEILFRGVIQLKAGIYVSSVLFGLFHPLSRIYVLVTILMGFYIGLFFLIYKSLFISIQLHFVYDLGALIYLKYFVKARPL
jgi:membrane protease YdiL (CAAX protease family)